MKFNIHAGHNPDGKVACGAIGLIKESTEARKVKDYVITTLRSLGHTVYDCTENNGTNARDVLQKIVSKCNRNSVDLDISIHFNSGRKDLIGDGSIGGTEVYVYNATGTPYKYATSITNNISSLGFKNRGVKVNTGLYVLANTKAPALLIECCFVDDADDVKLYDATKMASAIVTGLTGTIPVINNDDSNISHNSTTLYDSINVGDILEFKGKSQYSSADSNSSKEAKTSRVKVTKKYLEASKHPVHVRSVDSTGKYTNGVYGWVDLKDLSSINDNTYKVKVKVPELEYRGGPGISYKSLGVIKDQGVYTIIQECNGWGQLKSKVGWINLSSTTRI